MPPYRTQLKIINWIHAIQVVLAVGAMAVCGYRMLTKSIRSTRSDIMALGAGAKSLIIIAYMVLTENVKSFYRFGNYTAYMILNVIELVFWAAVAAMGVMSLLKGCKATGCILSGVTVGLAVAIASLAFPLVIMSIYQWRCWKKTGIEPHEQNHAGDEYPLSPKRDSNNVEKAVY